MPLTRCHVTRPPCGSTVQRSCGSVVVPVCMDLVIPGSCGYNACRCLSQTSPTAGRPCSGRLSEAPSSLLYIFASWVHQECPRRGEVSGGAIGLCVRVCEGRCAAKRCNQFTDMWPAEQQQNAYGTLYSSSATSDEHALAGSSHLAQSNAGMITDSLPPTWTASPHDT